MADDAASERKWWSWLILAGVLALGLIAVIFTYGDAVPLWVRLVILGAWGAITLTVILLDKYVVEHTDSTAFDIWTIAHGFAGVVFGYWFLPLWLVLTMTILWEVFEKFVPGFGDKEIMWNRVVDVGIATTMWLIVVFAVSTSAHVGFPLLVSHRGGH